MTYYNNKTKLFNNQHTITIDKEDVKSASGRQYFSLYSDALYGAMSDLTGTELKVWLYLMNNKNGYVFGYSPEDVARKTGMSKDAAKKAKLSLISKGYITQDDDCLIFHDKPQTAPKLATLTKKRTFLQANGTLQAYTLEELAAELRILNPLYPDAFILDIWNNEYKEEI